MRHLSPLRALIAPLRHMLPATVLRDRRPPAFIPTGTPARHSRTLICQLAPRDLYPRVCLKVALVLVRPIDATTGTTETTETLGKVGTAEALSLVAKTAVVISATPRGAAKM